MSDENDNGQSNEPENDKTFKDLLDQFSGNPSKTNHVMDSAEPDLLQNILREREKRE